MDMLKNRKRDKKTLSKTKANKGDGTIDFLGDTDKGKKGSSRKVGDKKGGPKFSGSKSPFKKFKKEGGEKKVVDGATNDQTGEKQSNSQIRRQKKKVSDLIKKLRINYNKLLMKKKEATMDESTQRKSEVV